MSNGFYRWLYVALFVIQCWDVIFVLWLW
jgi:hypothetical protein